MLEKKFILGVGITDATEEQVLEFIVRGLENKGEKYFIVTPNPEFLVLADGNPEYKSVLNKAKIALNDGFGVVLASKLLGKGLRERVTGTDLLENLCQRVAEKPITVGFLGGGHKIAETTAECLRKKYPGLRVAFAGSEWPNASAGPAGLHPRPTSSVASLSSGARRGSPAPATRRLNLSSSPRLNNLTIDILFVAYGAPKQELWIYKNLDKIPVRVAIGVGGAFDYISGKIPRAPEFVRNIGFEWLFRLVIQPWRIKRQLSLLKFIWLVVKEKINKN